MPPNVQSGPLVSVVIPVWNYASFLPTAIDSVIGQTYRRWHCLIVDDGSTDSTPDVARTMVARDANAATERGIAWDDPGLGIPWPTDQPIVSERDRHNPMLAQISDELPGSSSEPSATTGRSR